MTPRCRFVALLVAALGLATAACAPVIGALPQIVAVITNASATLQLIDSAVRAWLDRHPGTNPALRERYRGAYERCLSALDAATHALSGADKLDQQEVDAAFAEFKLAYLALRDMLVLERVAAPAADGQLTVELGVGDRVVLAEPDVLWLQVVPQ
jgi:hypothetical protein